MAYDVKKFNTDLNADLKKLQKSELVVKATLSALSRQILSVIHDDINPDVQPVNRLLAVLTPMNRRTVILFYQHFSGHLFSEKEQKFEKRDKKQYEKKAALSAEFLEDPLNNIWTWAERHVEMEKKEWKLEKVTEYIMKALKKAEQNNVSQEDFIKAILAGGVKAEALLEILKAQADEIVV